MIGIACKLAWVLVYSDQMDGRTEQSQHVINSDASDPKI
jgi:hypothetical protein